jgi:hypothetical protein
MRKRDANFFMMDRATASRTHQRGGKDAEGFLPSFSPLVGHLSMRQRSTPELTAQPSTKSPSCAVNSGAQLGTCERRLRRGGRNKAGNKHPSPAHTLARCGPADTATRNPTGRELYGSAATCATEPL